MEEKLSAGEKALRRSGGSRGAEPPLGMELLLLMTKEKKIPDMETFWIFEHVEIRLIYCRLRPQTASEVIFEVLVSNSLRGQTKVAASNGLK